tara:strand:- start:308 stop:559 length:252 start_codon:yes stop_codon:yes gene_type:complete
LEKSFFEDPVNFYSLVHFLEYGLLAIFPKVTSIHILIISIAWEIIELFLPYKWASESIANKILDILFNFSGYYFVRTFLYKVA